METKLLVLHLVLVSGSLLAQGRVGFGNDSARMFVMGTSTYVSPEDEAFAGQPIPSAGLPSGSLSVLLYAGTTAGALTLQTAIPLTGTSLPTDGRMATKNVLLTIPGGVVQQFQIFLVNTSAILPNTIVGGAKFLATGLSYFGTSGLFTFTPGTGVAYPLIYGGTSTWATGPVVVIGSPEPGTASLLGLGLVALFVSRRNR